MMKIANILSSVQRLRESLTPWKRNHRLKMVQGAFQLSSGHFLDSLAGQPLCQLSLAPLSSAGTIKLRFSEESFLTSLPQRLAPGRAGCGRLN